MTLSGSQERFVQSRQKVTLLVVVSYLHAVVRVSKAQLSAHHHGLFGTPAFSTDQTPVLRSISVGAQHFHTALIACTTACDTHLIRKHPK